MLQRKILPESFHLACGAEYDAHIEKLNDEINQEGDASLYLGKIRYERRNHGSFYLGALAPLARLALSLEVKSPLSSMGTEGVPHALAHTAMAGMIFGHLINERIYPDTFLKQTPYKEIPVYENLMSEAMIDAVVALRNAPGWRTVGYRAMAHYMTQQLSDNSLESINRWSSEVIDNTNQRPHFLPGLGLALYTAWDTYSDLMTTEGRGNEVRIFTPSPQPEPPLGT